MHRMVVDKMIHPYERGAAAMVEKGMHHKVHVQVLEQDSGRGTFQVGKCWVEDVEGSVQTEIVVSFYDQMVFADLRGHQQKRY